jgi:hypothetical protein
MIEQAGVRRLAQLAARRRSHGRQHGFPGWRWRRIKGLSRCSSPDKMAPEKILHLQGKPN